jgi:hypothetical protein
MDKDKALQMCLEYIETDAEKDAHERKYVRLAIKQALAAQPAAVQGSLSFNCSAGCGACGVNLQDFVTHRTQAQEGDDWVVVGTEPQIVSTCCGSPVEVWDERKQDITASVDATPPPAQPNRGCGRCKDMSKHCDITGSSCAADYLDALAAPVQEPVAWMKEGWGPDCGPYIEFYRDDEMGWRDRKEWTPLYTTPPAQEFVCSTGLCHYKAVPDAIHHTDLSEHPEYISGWNDYRKAMMEMMK